MPQIAVESLVKTYRIAERRPGLWGAFRGIVQRSYRTIRALDGIFFSLEAGELVGYIGPNGAGAWIGCVETHTYSGPDGCNFQNIIEGGPVFRRLINYPAWINHCRRWINPTNGISIHENLLNVRGRGGYIGIHCGGACPISYLTFRQENTGEWMVGQINVIVAVQEVGPGDGATTVVPGSHKSAMRHPMLTESTYRQDDAAGNQFGMRELYLEAGDVLC